MGLLKPQGGGGKIKRCILGGGNQKPIYTDGVEFIWGRQLPSATQLSQIICPYGSQVKPTSFTPLYFPCSIYSRNKKDLYKVINAQLYGASMYSAVRGAFEPGERLIIYPHILDGLEYFYFNLDFIYFVKSVGSTAQVQRLEIFYQD